jgi:Fe-S oxidoreductase/nitrate reductase gamma subunit
MTESITPAREVFRHFPVALIALFYVLAVMAMAVAGRGLWLRVRKYAGGRRGEAWSGLRRRVLVGMSAILAHTTLARRHPWVGLFHAAIFWGFLALFVGTLIIMVDYDMLRLVVPEWRFWRGTFYLWYSLVLDVLGLGFVAALGAMMIRRWFARPAALDYARPDRGATAYDRAGYVADDRLFLWLLFSIGVTGYLVEGFRIAADRPAFETWSVVGWPLARALEAAGLGPRSDVWHAWTWWVHAVLALGFVAYVPYSKAVHVVVDVVNLLLRDPLSGKRLPPAPEGSDAPGYRSMSDFTWKDLLDLDACTKCGRCHVACPARAAGAPLSPRDLILELREHAEAMLGGGEWLRERQERSAGDQVTGTVIRPETLWACTTCRACVEACPVGIGHVPLIVQMRRTLVAEGTLDANLQSVLERLGRYGNSFGQSERNRARWTQGLPFTVRDARKDAVDTLWFVGDYASYDPALQGLTRGVARIFQRAGLDWGLLHEAERNAGNDVRRAGEEGLFQVLAEKNVAALAKARFREIVTTDPHSYNTLRFEYPELGAAYPVRHYTEVLAEHLRAGLLRVEHPLEGVVTYHDPCYLSRYTEVTEPPRQIIAMLGLTLVEMRRSRAASFCCGAGGGRIWMADTRTPGVPTAAEQRIAEALEIPGVRYFIVACPKDATMYRDAVKTGGFEGRIEVKEIGELIESALGSETPPAAVEARAG